MRVSRFLLYKCLFEKEIELYSTPKRFIKVFEIFLMLEIFHL